MRARCSRRWRPTLWQGASAVLGVLYPPSCNLCGRDLPEHEDEALICGQCRDGLILAGQTPCPRCARPVAAGDPAGGDGCVACRNRRLRFATALALGVYGGLLRDAVLRMKHAAGEPLVLAMGRLLADHLQDRLAGPFPDLVAPVPMHWARRLLRGVNCPEILVEVLSGRLRMPAQPHLLRCRRKTRKQGTLLPAERLENVRGAYGVSAGYDITGAHVLVVDDVMTTGATANEIANVLRRAGADRVSLAVVARGSGFD